LAKNKPIFHNSGLSQKITQYFIWLAFAKKNAKYFITLALAKNKPIFNQVGL
jgi:hypothetical protein